MGETAQFFPMQDAHDVERANEVPRAGVPQMVALVLLLATAGILECRQLTALHDPEIWGHLGIGGWILQHKSLPESGVLSQAAGLPWRDYHWGFDLLAAAFQRILGLRALPALLIVFRVALAGVTFQLAGGWRNFWGAAGLSTISQYILYSGMPLRAYVSALFFGMELFLLCEWRESGRLRRWFVFPALFFLWANLDLGFVYGIGLYTVFLTILAIEQLEAAGGRHWLEPPAARIPFLAAARVGGACFVAGCLTPNTIHAYSAFFRDEFSVINANLSSFHAMGFRQPQDYALMLLAMAAFLSWGLVRSRDVFLPGVLSGCTALGFFAQREGWLLALASVAVIGRAMLRMRGKGEAAPSAGWNRQRLTLAAAAVVSAFFVFAIRVPRNQEILLAKVADTLPVRAADFLRQHPQPQPIFNPYQWGGFLTWYLPEYPVAMDARWGLYPEQQGVDYFRAMNAGIPYKSFPPMSGARTFLLDKAGVMGEAFRGVAGFQVLYEDNLAIVYSHEVKE